MKLLRVIWQASRSQLSTVVALSIFNGVGNALFVAWIGKLLSQHQPISTSIALAFALLACTIFVLDSSAKQLLVRLASRTTYLLRVSISRQILAMPLETIEKIGSPRLMAILTEDIVNLSVALHSLPNLCVSSATVLFCLLYLTWSSPTLVFLLGVILIIPYFVYRFLQRKAYTAMQEMLRERNKVFTLYKALIEGIQELKLNADRRTAFVQELLEPYARQVQNRIIESRTWHQITQLWSQAVFIALVIVALLWNTYHAGNPIDLTAYAFVILLSRGALANLLSLVPIWTDANTIIRQMESVEITLTLEHPPLTSPPPPKPEQIYLKMVQTTFRYSQRGQGEHFQIGPLNLEFRSGEIVFLTGGNGSGKTTLLKLLSGLYTPTEGSLCLNGETITTENYEAYRQNFSALWIDFFLFEQLLGISPAQIDERARLYLQQLQLDQKVTIAEGLLSTTELSHGQRKRLALLTAYMEDRPIYLFDEWASGQDPEFREVFYRQLLPDLKKRGKLVLVISHDDAYFDVADRRIHLDYGQVVAN